MTESSEDRAKRLFEAVSAAEPEHREAVLAALDPSLRKEVESLLAAEDDSVFEKAPPGADSLTVDKTTAIKPIDPDTSVRVL